MRIDDLGLGDLDEEQSAVIRAMSTVKARGGSMFAASQQMGNPGGLEFTGDTVRAVAERLATANFEIHKEQEADQELRRVAATTETRRGALSRGRGRDGRWRGGRVSWKVVAAKEKMAHRKHESESSRRS
mmetsp:Transcript_59075/g.80663  ORF Transcript_59075/g.80663 Transcript_59075/m.80663 type:complete len:130 (-) Transcript_59075:148-537(-)